MPSQNTVKQHITTAIKKADLTTVSAKQIRRTVEKQLGLAENELSNEKWKTLVKGWIQEAMAAIERGETETEPEDPKHEAVRETQEEGKIGMEILEDGLIVAKKRRKKAVIQETPESSPVKVKSPKKSPKQSSQKKVKDNEEEVKSPPTKKRKTGEEENNSDSDMSVLIDSTPPKTKPAKPAKSTKSTESNKPAKPTVTKSSSTDDEVKHLKSLVFKCGVRKNWYPPMVEDI